jgi:hypothetical protein
MLKQSKSGCRSGQCVRGSDARKTVALPWQLVDFPCQHPHASDFVLHTVVDILITAAPNLLALLTKPPNRLETLTNGKSRTLSLVLDLLSIRS